MFTSGQTPTGALAWVLAAIAALQLLIGWLASPRFPKYNLIPERSWIRHESK